ncbi:MAG: glycerate kinase [Nocardioides sp.]|nr:glycerate kinase [Nocardioides sp.]
MRVVVAPDKFKGSLTAVQAAQAIADGLRRGRADIDVVQLPVADGGDGTVSAAIAAGYGRRTATVQGPTGEPVEATFAVRGDQAVLELAEASGLSRLPHGTFAPLTASTYGTGQLLLAALDAGCRHLILGVGGSASTDGGVGMVQALGARFLSAAGEEVDRGGVALLDLDRIDTTLLDPRLASTTVVLACDVDNPLVGAQGAATVYGPQKGANSDDVKLLDTALSRYAEIVHRDMGVHLSHRAGAGAAGGTGAGAIAFLGAISSSGIALMLEVVGFAGAVEGADLVITGEGSLDAQSLSGKTPVGVARAAASAGVPVIALVGRLEVGPDELRAAGITGARALLELEPDDVLAQRDAAVLLGRLAEQVGASL